jgi:ribose 5-phosphate isomerase B
MKLIIGSDNIGYKLKEFIKTVFDKNNSIYFDVGVFNEEPMDYPDIAVKVANMIASGEYDRGILICGTGIGMAIAANKVKGIRAAVCHDIYSTERSRKSNNVQIMTLGALVIGEALAKTLVETWLKTEFMGGLSIQKIDKISQIENYNKNKS